MAEGGGAQSVGHEVNRAERYIERLAEDMTALRGMEERINNKIDNLEGRLNGRMDRLDNRMESTEKHVRGMAIATIGGMIATLLAVCGLVYAVLKPMVG